ncbi:tape measure protein [Arthrobacter phage Tribby]|uniref:Tape measure protein n=1 Tax=Arthrobacter phage Tribby TaxID=2024279 RepID=A0A222Z8M7_9CAUD|nr:tail length tape measure protein [Arthrobacter phage Tribby]ASR80473.1 tape measure protein [Arthrobacter phage Tribby]
MSTIDERVVAMKFDNAQFARGVSDTTKSLDGLKKSLQLEGGTKGLDGVDAAAKRLSFQGIADGISNISSKFSALSIVGITALTNIANKAVDAGINLAKSITTEPIMDGFNEYELKMGSIQTILANTAQHGTDLKQVTGALEELNHYADKTIYNFGDMTRNIGMFTNAGIKLEDATAMIKGFSNEAAASGTNAAQASGAAYQLSQAMSKGKVTLEDWRSLTNASMGSKNMQNGLIDIAKAMGAFNGTGTDAIAVAKDFNGSLEKGWLKADVMTNYLKIQAGELSAEQMKTLGLTDEQIDRFTKQQVMAEEAATKVRTWTQLIGTLKESVGSSWATTFELLLGDFDSATVMFTNVNNTLGDMIGAAGDARNKLIKEWQDLGGRDIGIYGIALGFAAIMNIIKPIGDAFREIFPPITAQRLVEYTQKFRDFMASLVLGQDEMLNLKRTFRGVFSVFDLGFTIIGKLLGVVGRLFGSFQGGRGNILSFTGDIGDWLVKVTQAIKSGEGFNKFFDKLGKAAEYPAKIIRKIVDLIRDMVQGFRNAVDGVDEGIAKMGERFNFFEKLGAGAAGAWGGFIDWLRSIGGAFKPLGDFFRNIGSQIGGALKNMDFDQVLDIINVGLIGGLVLMFRKFFFGGGLIDQIKELFGGDGPGIIESIKEVFGGLTDTLSAMQAQLKAGTLVAIAIAVGILTASAVALSTIDSGKLTVALSAMGVMFAQLLTGMAVFDKISGLANPADMAGLAVALVLIAVALRILASSVEKLGKLDWKTLVKGLGAVVVLLGALAVTSRIMSKYAVNLIPTAIGLVILAGAIKILETSVKTFAEMDMKKLAKGLIGVGALLGALTLWTKFAQVSPGAIGQATAIVILAAAIKIMASAVEDFGSMDVKTLVKGFLALDILMAQIVLFIKWTQGAVGMVAAATGVVILAAAMKIMADVIMDLGAKDMKTLAKGLLTMGIALVGIAAAMNMMPPNMIVNAVALVAVAAALKIIASALKDMSGMSWEEIAKGLVLLAGSLLVITLAMAGMTGALPGAAALLVVAFALSVIAPVLLAFGEMSWEAIGKGLTMLAASLLIIGLGAALLTPAIPVLIGLGVAIGLIGVGVMLAGAGLFLFAAGLTAAAAAGAAGSIVLIGFIQGLLGLLPYAFEQFGKGVVAFAKVIGENGPTFVQAMVTLLDSILTAINTMAPKIVATLFNLIMLLLQTLVDNIPKFVDAGMKILIGFLDGIANNIGQVVTSATNVIVNFIDGIANNLDRIINSGMNLVVKFVDGVAKGIENNSQAMRDAGGRLAMAIADGMTGGLASKIKDVVGSAMEMGRRAISGAKQAIDSNSPSKEFHKLGVYSGEGFVGGIEQETPKVGIASATMAKTALSTLGDTLNKASVMGLFSDLNMQPVIRPVMDLSSVKRGAAQIGGMIPNGPALTIDDTYAKASSLVERENIARQQQIEQSNAATQQNNQPGETIVKFEQNNYSPKALSPSEIYRNTNNQLSAAKGVLIK